MLFASAAAETIDDVVDQLDDIVDRARRDESCAGYFAVLYRNVTVRVKERIAQGRFDDGDRMERLDVLFANRYLHAYASYRSGSSPTRCWTVAFEASERWRPFVLQHLLLGMNAHINLDLGIAAARTSPGRALVDMEADFRQINAILIDMLDDVQRGLGTVSPWLQLLDYAGGTADELLSQIGLMGSRDWAWMSALHLAALGPDEQQPVIDRLDRSVAGVGRTLLNPGAWFRTVALVVRLAERKSVGEVMDALTLP